jgi:hypothetical protein
MSVAELLDGLNPVQRDAVTAPDGRVWLGPPIFAS